jgi:predicted permease
MWSRVRSLFSALFHRARFEDDMSSEMRFHIEAYADDLVRAGMPREEAVRRARVEFGGTGGVKDEARHARGLRLFDELRQDLRYARRTLRRSPGFLTVSVLSLALGIGANTAIFGLINAVMFRSLPVTEPERLVQTTRLSPEGNPSVSYPLFEYFRDNLTSISGAAARLDARPSITMDGAEELVRADLVSGGHYGLLGIEPAAGRLLEPADDLLTPAAPAAVISYRYWQRRFGLSPAAIGKTFTLHLEQPSALWGVFTIVGVTPPGYEGTVLGNDPDMTLPLSMMLSDEQRHGDTHNMLNMLARLAPGVTIEQADAELQARWQIFLQRVAARLPEKHRAGILSQRAAVLNAANGINPLREHYLGALVVLMGIVALVLLLACANLSGLLVARAASREREIAIRLAIGAGRARLMRQFLTESLLLAALGGSAGLVLAGWFSSVLLTMLANGETLRLSTAPDWRVLAFTGAISLLACVLAGFAPGLHALRGNLHPGLKQTRTSGSQRVGKTLVIAQIAISMVLVVGATLFTGTLVKLYRVDRGVRTDGVLTFRLRTNERNPPPSRWASAGTLLDRVSALPGVASASAVDFLPISGSLWAREIQVEGYTFRVDEPEEAAFNAIAPKYFTTVGTPLRSGREFDERDTKTGPRVIIVNESFARYFFGARSPLGRHVTSRNVAYEIVGVARDAKYEGLREEMPRTLYMPWTQREGEELQDYHFLARVTTGDPMRLVPALEKVVRQADPGLRLFTARTYAAVVDQSIVTERLMAALGSFFGVLALIVAGLGIFGVMALQVSRRVSEIGLRMALGAQPREIVALVLREVAVLVIAGCVIGGAAALTLTGLTRSMLFGITPTEPAAFALSAVALAGAAFAAGWLPARRASRVDPLVALRHE